MFFFFELEINDPLNVDDGQHQIQDHASIPGNEFIHIIHFYIEHFRWITLIVHLHISTTDHVEVHSVQVECGQKK